MKYPSISLFPETGSVYVSFFDDNNDYVKINMSAERFKRVLMHPNHQLQGVSWSDTPNHVGYYPYGNLLICSQDFARILGNHPLELERLFKRCFLNVLPELAGAEIRDVEIKVYYPTQDADAQ